MDALCMTSEEFDEYLRKGDTLEIGRDHPHHTGGEPSYGMAIMSGRRSGKMQELVDNLTSRCNELAAERDNILDRYNHSVSENTNLRSRCEELRVERDNRVKDIAALEVELDTASRQQDTAWRLREKACDERDEGLARCEKLNAMCIELATDYAEVKAERDEARQWARKLYKERSCRNLRSY